MTAARRFVWRHPHWWAVVVCAAAWGWLTFRWWGSRHAHGFALLDWTLMVVAMMLPLVFEHLRVTAARSLWPRRHRAMAGFLCGYVAIFLLAGLALSLSVGASGLLAHGAGSRSTVAAALALAATWQLSRAKRRSLTACHRSMPLAPRGWRAHYDCLRYGWTIGRSCLVSCAGLMLACVVSAHSLPMMMTATAVAGAERVSPRADPSTTFAALSFVAAAQVAGIF